MLKIFTLDVYVLLDPGATLSFVTPLVAKKFDVLPDILHEPFLVSTPLGESVVTKRVYTNFPLILPNIVTQVELVEHDMIDFDSILGMHWLHDCFAFSFIDNNNCPVKISKQTHLRVEGGKFYS